MVKGSILNVSLTVSLLHYSIFMKTPSFCFRSTIICAFLFASFFHLRVYANRIDDSPPDPTIEVTGDFDFGSVFFGTQPSQPRQFVIRNVGQQEVTFNVTVSNPDFTYFSDASSTLWPGDSVLSYVAFKPSVVGVISGTLTITSDDPVNPVLNFNITGVGLTSPVEETFIQDTVIETFTTTRLFKITNTSNEQAEFHLEPFQNNFIQFPINTFILNTGESVWAELRFTGFGHVGYDNGVFLVSNLSIDGNALDPIFISVELLILEEPWGPLAYVQGGSNADFGPAFVGGDIKSTVILEIENPSPTPLICNLSSSDPNFRIYLPEFWTYGSDSTFIVNRDDFFSAGYTFVPLAVGDFSGVITLTTNDPDRPLFTWTVRGTGVEAPFQTVQDSVIEGEQSSKVVTIRNTTPEPLDFYLAPKHNDEHNSFLELSIAPDTISLPAGGVGTFEVLFDATGFTPGVYYGAIEAVCHCNYGDIEVPFVVTILDSPQAIELPDSIHIEIPIGTMQSSSFVIQNTGNVNLDYSIETGSIESGNGSRLYDTGFEEFNLGSIQFMGGWYAADDVYFSSDNPGQVANENPFSGSKHLRYVSSEGEKLFSPILNTSASDISIVDMMIDFEPGVTWKINAFVIHPDGSMSVETGFPSDQLHSISGSLPEGYFNLRFSIKKSTQEYSISVNGNVIYTGTSYISDFSQVVFLGGFEQYGKNLDIDDLRVIVGDEERSFLSAVPSSGTIPPLGSQIVNLLVDAHNINAGVYNDSIVVHSSDSLAAVLSIPFEAIVKENIPPEFINVPDSMIVMVAGDTLFLTFAATDVDDSFVSVTSFNVNSYNAYNYDFEFASGNGYTTIGFFAPDCPIDSHFTGMILATDARGGVSSKYFVIHVLAHDENDFVLTNFKTKVELEAFTDTLVLDIARPDIDKLTIQFKTLESYFLSPDASSETDLASPKSVTFSLDGVFINSDKSSPYYIDAWQIPKLSEGYHTLTAFTDYTNDGEELGASGYSTRQAVIHVINSTFISGFDVVDLNGAKLMDLVEGSIIDLSQPGFNSFNVLANPSLNSIRSVKFTLNNVTARIDNGAPYALGGNPISGDTFWKAKAGQYTLTAIPYMKYFAWGPSGTPLTIHFQVVNGTIPSTATARIANATASDTQQSEETSDVENVLSIYPVPVKDELHIELHESVKGDVVVNIMSIHGKSMNIRSGDANEFRKYSFSTEQLGISRGIYFVMVTQANGKRLVKKFIKE